MIKRCVMLGILGWFAGGLLMAQKSSESRSDSDSLNLKRMLESDGEIRINRELLDCIDFGQGVVGNQQMVVDKPWMELDVSLPDVESDEITPEMREMLSLTPYKPSTPYNWDPIYRRKISVNADTWRGDPFYKLRTTFRYSNRAYTPFGLGDRRSVQDIEDAGLQYQMFSGRANNRMVGAWAPVGGGAAVSGLDFMAILTRDFWNPKARKRRMRTMEVLQEYGDSVVATLPVPVQEVND